MSRSVVAAAWVVAVGLIASVAVQAAGWQEQKRQNCLVKVQIGAAAFIAGDYSRDADVEFRRQIATALEDEADTC